MCGLYVRFAIPLKEKKEEKKWRLARRKDGWMYGEGWDLKKGSEILGVLWWELKVRGSQMKEYGLWGILGLSYRRKAWWISKCYLT